MKTKEQKKKIIFILFLVTATVLGGIGIAVEEHILSTSSLVIFQVGYYWFAGSILCLLVTIISFINYLKD